ncbi:MAG: serine hydrolase domain-containing protein, partial [Nocardioides sp.]
MSQTWLDAPERDDFLRRTASLVATTSFTTSAHRVRSLEVRRAERTGAPRVEGTPALESFLLRTGTDGLVVLRGDQIVLNWYAPGMTARSPHLLMSLSKALAGVLAGALVEAGDLTTTDHAVRLVPELTGSAYAEATIQDLLDMTVSVEFGMDFDQPEAEVLTLDRVAGWRAARPQDPPTIRSFLATIKPGTVRAPTFQYCSATTDVLAWVLERAAGRSYVELACGLWRTFGPEDDAAFTVDADGVPYASAGLCATTADIARFGRSVLD